MYAENYKRASELAERIRNGQYKQESQARKEKLGSFMDRKPVEKKPEKQSELDSMATMIAALRNQVEEAKPAINKVAAVATDPSEVGRRLMTDLMRDFDLTATQAAGFVGNLDYESGGFKHMQEINPTVKGSKGGYGYAQWTGPRRKEFESWAKAEGLDINTYEANYGNLKRELSTTGEGKVLDSLRETSTPEDAAMVVSNTFLRPGKVNMSGRIKKTYNYIEAS